MTTIRRGFISSLFLFLMLLVPVSLQAESEKGRENPICLIKTSFGTIHVELFIEEAPRTVKNFIRLAEGKEEDGKPEKERVKKHFYDNLIFHRVIKDFMIQGGCPKGNGTGGPGYAFKDEINANSLGLDKINAVQSDGRPHRYLLIRNQGDFSRKVLMPLARKLGIRSQEAFQQRNKEIEKALSELTLKECYENLGYRYNDNLKSHALKRGVLAMANSGPNTNGSQFFINLVDTPWLTGKHTVFGKVVMGMDIVDKIGSVAVDKRRKPLQDVVILSIRLQETKKQ